jgi:protein-disulfide isomerase
MSTSENDPGRMTKNQRRDAAREKARQLREQQRKKDRRNKFILQGSLIVVTLGIVAAIALVIYSTIRPPAPGPLNMLSDGIKIGENFEAVPTGALQPGREPVPSASNASSDVLDIRIYVDYMCPYCAGFEAANSEQIATLVEDGAATVEIHPVAILDRLSMGTRYSTRAANAAACVANYSPDNFFEFNSILFEHQPEENSSGLSDDELVGYAKEVGVSKFSKVSECITSQQFKNWVGSATDRFTKQPLPKVAAQPATQGSTPTVYVNGQQYVATLEPGVSPREAYDPKEFASFLVQVLGTNFVEDSTPSPSPTPSLEPEGQPIP